MPRFARVVAGLILCGLLMTAPAYGAVTGDSGAKPIELTLEQAVSRALSLSNALKKAEADLQKAQDARVWAPVTDYISYSAAGEARIFAAESTNHAYEKARRSYDLQRDVVILDITKKYYDVLGALEKLETKKSAYTHVEAEIRAARAMFAVGMVGLNALNGAQARLEGAKAELAEAQAGLDNAFLAFNQLLGYNTSERPQLVDTVSFEPVSKEFGIYRSRALSDNPTLGMVSAAVSYLKSVENYTAPAGMTAPTSTDVWKAELDALTARDGVDRLIHHLYSGVKALEVGRAAAEKGLAIAEENLRITRLKHEVGLTTRTAVLDAEARVSAARHGLFDLTARHAYLKQAMDRPWAYVSMNSGS